MPTTNKDFVVKNGLVVNGLTTNGYVTTTNGLLGSVATIPNSGLTNSTITINGTPVSLGGSTTVSAGAISTLTIGTGLTGGSFNGTSPVTIANDGVLTVNGSNGAITDIATLTSPTFTGTPAAPTAAVDTSTTQIATTAFVINQGYLKSATASSTYLPIASPVFTTLMSGPLYNATATLGTNSTTGIYSYGTLGYSDKHNMGVFATTINDYVQFVLQNKSNGTAASVDFVVSNDTGTANATYGDFGINSSTYTGTGAFNAPNNVYLFAANGDLVVGTTTTNAFRIVVNNGTTDAFSISSAGVSTFTGQTIFPASTTAASSIRLPHGTAPTTPVNGDVWTTTTGMFARINGATVGPFSTGGAALNTTNAWTGLNSWSQVGTFSYSTINTANNVPALNLSGSTKTGNPLNMATGLLQVGPLATSVGGSPLADTNILGVFSQTFNDYIQTLFINPSNGTSASADICLYNDATLAKGGLGSYADIGLSSSTYTTNSFWPAFSTAGGMYIYMQAGALTIGTQHNAENSPVPYNNDLMFASDDQIRVIMEGGKTGDISNWVFQSNLNSVIFNTPISTRATTTASTNSTALTIRTGNATGTTSSSGLISIDTGTGTTAAGVINIGTTTSPTVNIGRFVSTAAGGTSVSYPAAGTLTTATQSAGYMGMPLNAITASGTHTYTFQASDAGKNIYVTGTPTSSTLTINSNANLALPIGTTFVIMNDLGAATNILIAITTDTMQLAGTGTTGTRTLARYGVATVTKVTATKWIISGNGLT